MKKLVPMVAGVIITGVLFLMSAHFTASDEQAVSGTGQNTPVISEHSATADLSGVSGTTEAPITTDSPIKVTSTEGIQPGGSIRAKVKRIVDGDTLSVEYKGEDYKVRLLCIDTPETVKVGVDEQPYGKQASDKLTEMVLDKEVALVFEKDIDDRYDRLLAYVILDNGMCVNAYLVENGFARVDIVRPNSVNKDYFYQLQDNAIKENRGLWSLPEDKRPFVRNDKGYYVPQYIEEDAA
ncbi:MAG: thermonuclease family protein [Clostridiaceae bacterium]